jgi:hypothetical protein
MRRQRHHDMPTYTAVLAVLILEPIDQDRALILGFSTLLTNDMSQP